MVKVNEVKVNEKCIGCGLCMSLAPSVFKVSGVPAIVIKQPTTKEENDAIDQAIASCPVQAISKKSKDVLEMAA